MNTPPASLPDASSHPAKADRRRLAIASVLGGWTLAFWPAILGRGVPYDRDLVELYLPLRAWLRPRLLAVEWPEWYPLDALGTPLLGQFVHGLYHPLTWLTLPLPAATGLAWTLLLALLGAMCGAYRLSRTMGADRTGAVLGSYAFGLSGYAVSLHDNPPYLLGLATMPWVFDAALRLADRAGTKDAAHLAAAWALVLLAGDAQGFATCGLFVAAALAIGGGGRRAAGLAMIALGAALLSAGVELWPAVHVAAESVRAQWTASDALASEWALHPRRLPDFFLAHFVPKHRQVQMGAQLFGGILGTWAGSLYVGVPVLALAAMGLARRERRTWVLGGLALLGLWLALGAYGGLLTLAAKLVPFVAKFRYPEKHVAVVMVSLAPLVALGWAPLQRASLRFAIALGLVALGCAAFGLASRTGATVDLLWASAGLPPPAPETRQQVADAWTAGALQSALLCMTAALLAGLARNRPRVLAALPALVLLDLWLGNAHVFRLVPRDVIEAPGAFAQAVRDAAPLGGPPPRTRTLAPRTPIDPDLPGAAMPIVRHLRTVMLLDAGALDGLASLQSALPALSLRDATMLGTLGSTGPLDPLLDGCFAVGAKGQRLPPGAEVAARDVELGLGLAKMPCRGRAWLAPADARMDGAEAPPEAAGRITWRAYEPERLALDVEASASSWLVVADSYRSGWTATVDGRTVEIAPVVTALRGVPLPAGLHHVELRYRTPGLKAGLAASLAGVAVVAGLVLSGRGRRRRASSPAASETPPT